MKTVQSMSLGLLEQVYKILSMHLILDLVLFRASVDGGTNHLYNVSKDDPDAFLPDLITGDFDSIQDSVKQFYLEKVSHGYISNTQVVPILDILF